MHTIRNENEIRTDCDSKKSIERIFSFLKANCDSVSKMVKFKIEPENGLNF